MTLHKDRRIGRLSVLLLLHETEENQQISRLERDGWKVCLGRVGSMDAHKVVAAIETASKKSGVIQSEGYRESHALYHATMEALHGVTRGEMSLGSPLRTVGLKFAVLREIRMKARRKAIGSPFHFTARSELRLRGLSTKHSESELITYESAHRFQMIGAMREISFSWHSSFLYGRFTKVKEKGLK